MRIGLSRPAVVTATLFLALPVVAGCNSVDNARNCGKMAISITGDVQDLGDSALNVGQLTDASRRQHTKDALQKLGDDAKKIGDKSNRADLNNAVDKLNKAIQNAQDSLSHNKQPDLSPVTDAAGELGKVCVSN
ncbi:hypothetical protein [Kitasatospora kifunensis]|uniref:Secreted protein n=1 Tax=Kitasatospora kifunensis TaxID=58351 RepID=A0A7W7VVL1_KITKI|nr:hypothetical protein [Kitasatospora kifunensis]MBB4924511.1 hypothetical protein [Kitasatospora kifunensis]